MNFKLIKNTSFTRDKSVMIGITCYFITIVLVAIFTPGTCDSGDSITHFLFSKYAFQHPENFLNHWAKPLFVLLSAPFAAFGFVGIKLFNCCVAVLTVWFTYKVATKLNYKYAWLAALFLCFTPGFFIHIFSGLTEPLFSLIVILGIYLILSNRFWPAICLISFLPFVRSEGIIIIGVFAFYLIFNKQYIYLWGLLFGHLVYSFAGFFHYQDLLWVFTKIPYAASSGKYGSGNLSHFVIQLNYIIGIPLYILLGAGIIKRIIDLFKIKKKNIINSQFDHETILIFGCFLSFFLAHTLFWYFGLFESMGLKRVLICIVPLGILIALKGFNFILGIFNSTTIGYAIAGFLFAGFVVVFPFVPNPAAVNWQRDLSLTVDQELITEVVQFIQNDTEKQNISIYYSHPYISILMNRDPFDKKKNPEMSDLNVTKRPAHYLTIWDNWFSVIENGVLLNQLENDSKLKQLKSFRANDRGREIHVVVFEGIH